MKEGEYMVNFDSPKTYVIFGLGLMLLVCGGMYACPKYNVWEQTLAGEAEPKKAEWNRQISIKEAEAKHMAASELAKAEIERAKGVAEANRIIGDSLKDNESYLHYLWIHNLAETKDQVIYVPTETNLPVLAKTKN